MEAPLKGGWPQDLLEAAGLEPQEVEGVAEAIVNRLRVHAARGLRKTTPDEPSPRSLLSAYAATPQAAFQRLVGASRLEVPFVDGETRTLALESFAEIFGDHGMEPVVAVAHARLFVEMHEVDGFYGPLWRWMGYPLPVDIDRLAGMDWSVLLEPLERTQTATETVRTARRPATR